MRNQVLSALLRIKAGEIPEPTLGICANVCTLLEIELAHKEEEAYAFIEELVPRWPHFSGDPSYPVEGKTPEGGTRFWSQHCRAHRWDPEDDDGALRLDLLEWLIQELSK